MTDTIPRARLQYRRDINNYWVAIVYSKGISTASTAQAAWESAESMYGPLEPDDDVTRAIVTGLRRIR